MHGRLVPIDMGNIVYDFPCYPCPVLLFLIVGGLLFRTFNIGLNMNMNTQTRINAPMHLDNRMPELAMAILTKLSMVKLARMPHVFQMATDIVAEALAVESKRQTSAISEARLADWTTASSLLFGDDESHASDSRMAQDVNNFINEGMRKRPDESETVAHVRV